MENQRKLFRGPLPSCTLQSSEVGSSTIYREVPVMKPAVLHALHAVLRFPRTGDSVHNRGSLLRDGYSDHVAAPIVLIVDDDPRFLGQVRRMLDRFDFRLVCAQTSSAARSLATEMPISVAVVDYKLRCGDDGLELAIGLLRRHKVPYVLMSGYELVKLP